MKMRHISITNALKRRKSMTRTKPWSKENNQTLDKRITIKCLLFHYFCEQESFHDIKILDF